MTNKNELLDQLPSDPEELTALAESTDDVHVLDALANLPIGEVRYAVVSNPACHSATLTRIAREHVPEMPDSPAHWNELIMDKVRWHKNLPRSVWMTMKDYSLDLVVVPPLWSHQYVLGVAQSPKSTERMIRHATRDPRSDVRLSVALNPNAPDIDLLMLARDETDEVRETAQKRCKERNLHWRE